MLSALSWNPVSAMGRAGPPGRMRDTEQSFQGAPSHQPGRKTLELLTQARASSNKTGPVISGVQQIQSP